MPDVSDVDINMLEDEFDWDSKSTDIAKHNGFDKTCPNSELVGPVFNPRMTNPRPPTAFQSNVNPTGPYYIPNGQSNIYQK